MTIHDLQDTSLRILRLKMAQFATRGHTEVTDLRRRRVSIVRIAIENLRISEGGMFIL
jgi:hypothetical protein